MTLFCIHENQTTRYGNTRYKNKCLEPHPQNSQLIRYIWVRPIYSTNSDKLQKSPSSLIIRRCLRAVIPCISSRSLASGELYPVVFTGDSVLKSVLQCSTHPRAYACLPITQIFMPTRHPQQWNTKPSKIQFFTSTASQSTQICLIWLKITTVYS